MARFTAVLVPGDKPPYTTWTFVAVPAEVCAAWPRGGPHPVRGRLAGTAFRGTASRSAGVVRMPVPRELLTEAGLARGDRVEVEMELDPEPRPVEVPDELQAVLDREPELVEAFAALPPAHRRAWARHVGDAKREATRLRRAEAAIEGIRGKRFPGER